MFKGRSGNELVDGEWSQQPPNMPTPLASQSTHQLNRHEFRNVQVTYILGTLGPGYDLLHCTYMVNMWCP